MIDPYNKDNSYTYDFTGYQTTTIPPYVTAANAYLSTVVNSYEKCLITIAWNRIFNAGIFESLQVVRTTYTIKTHVDFIHNTATEFYPTGSFRYTFTGSETAAQSNLWSPCRMQNRYYWHPYAQLFFFMDVDISNTQRLIITCFPYTSGPSSACDTNFDQAGTPVFKNIDLSSLTVSGGTLVHIEEFVTFGMTTPISGVTQTKSAYVAVVVNVGGGMYESRIYRLLFAGATCAATTVSLESTPIYTSPPSSTINSITSLAAIHNVGIGFTIAGTQGIQIVSININGVPASSAITIMPGGNWKLVQMGIDSGDPPPVFAVTDSNKNSFYRITNIGTLVYTNSTLNFYDYPIDVGRFHFMLVYPGGCGETVPVDARDHNKISVMYISLETMQMDMCSEEMLVGTCGNGILDPGEKCDDGNTRIVGADLTKRGGDGCTPTCTVEVGWRCYNTPYVTRTLCEHNECGDSYINPNDPEFEECDDGNLRDNDGCTSTCKLMSGYFCPLPGYDCIKVCHNNALDYFPGPPYNIKEYKEACDDGNEISGDGNAFSIKLRMYMGLSDY